MKIALPNEGKMINQHFGKSKSFVIAKIQGGELINTEEMSVENLQHNHDGLSGFLLSQGVSIVIVGGIGEGALKALNEVGIKTIRGVSGDYLDVIKEYLKDDLKDKEVVCNHRGDHAGHHH